jgi:flagellar biosynthesis anti-sigma factor FlgM
MTTTLVTRPVMRIDATDAIDVNAANAANASNDTRHPGDMVAAAIQPVETARLDDVNLGLASALVAAAMQGPEVRWDKVATLRERIAAGTYRVSAAEIAERMMGLADHG